MIDDIVEMILKEARARKGKNPVDRIDKVYIEVAHRVCDIMSNLTCNEEEEKEDEKKNP